MALTLTEGFFPSGALNHSFKDIRVTTRPDHQALKFETSQFTAVGAPHQDEDVRYMVGVLDEGSNSLTLHPCALFSAKVTIKGDKGAPVAPSAPKPTTLSVGQAILAARKDLIGTFGAAKKKQEIAAVERNQVKAEQVQVMATKMGETMNAEAAMEGNVEQDADEFRPIPPFSLDAAAPVDAYPFDQLITPEEQAAMRTAVKPFINCTVDDIYAWRSTKKHPAFALDILEALIPITIPPKDRLARAIALQYVTWLCWFRIAAGRQSFTAETMAENEPSMPEEVLQRILSEFAERSGEGSKSQFVLSSRKKDLLVSYVLVLTMYANGFKPTPIGTISHFLGISHPKLGIHFRTLGCTLSGDGEDKLASLVVPLKFPKVRRGRVAK